MQPSKVRMLCPSRFKMLGLQKEHHLWRSLFPNLFLWSNKCNPHRVLTTYTLLISHDAQVKEHELILINIGLILCDTWVALILGYCSQTASCIEGWLHTTSLQIFNGEGLNFKEISSVLFQTKKGFKEKGFEKKGREDSVDQEINDMLGICVCVSVGLCR